MKKTLPFWIMIAVLAACGGRNEQSTPSATTSNGTVVIGIPSDIQGWNPYLVDDIGSEQVLALVYPTLAVEQPDYHLHPPSFAPSLARAWSWSEDHRILTVKLDPQARWSDGVAITAEDVVFTWRSQIAPEVGWIHAYGKDFITAVEAVDAHTVRVTYNHAYPYQLMDLNDGPIIPAHRWREIPYADWPETDWREHVVAGGPFVPLAHTPQQQITLGRNPEYFAAPLPILDRVVFRIVPTEQGLLNQLLSGGLDFVRSVPPSALERIRDHGGISTVVFDDRSYTHICWNTTDPLLADPAVRTALTRAIDRAAIIDVVFGGFGRIAVGPVLSSFWAFDTGLEPEPYDPAAARAALEAAGWRDTDGDGTLDRDGQDFVIELLAPAENQQRQDIAMLVQADLARVGVAVEQRVLEWGALMAALERGDFDGVINQWEEPTQIDLEGLWRSPPPGEATFNFGRYSNPEVDHLLDQVAGLTDPAAQKPILDRIQRLIVRDQPYTFLVENNRIAAHSTRIQGIEVNAATPYFNIAEWSVRNEPEQ